MEIWGGVECTVNRVGDRYFDQLKSNGHDSRIADLEQFAALGLRKLRYPFLWERMASTEGAIDWKWADERATRLRELEIAPIAGFLHHGSGPRHTSLLDPAFPHKLASYARAFANRYPWITDYTPINEPLTTARFSALYGFWYPHARDDASFYRALLNQCRATVLCMREIRQVNPAARLVQTDDLGRATCSPRLVYQRDFENERRWLAWDLLAGRVDREHALRPWFAKAGIAAAEIDWFVENPCAPDVIGINHYPLSNRHLDENLGLYPVRSHGGNGLHAYADIEGVRTRGVEVAGIESLLREAWARYRLPMAVTEVHLGSSRDEQLRWLMEIWRKARALSAEGVAIQAVTAWGLLGHFDWHCLVTRDEGIYEPGVYDLRARRPRPTALAGAIASLAQEGDYDHPVLDSPGWWRRDDRHIYPLTATLAPMAAPARPTAPDCPPISASRRARVGAGVPGAKRRRLFVTGGAGTLGQAFGRVCEARGLEFRLLSREELDIGDARAVSRLIDEARPWAVVNAAGFAGIARAEVEEARCFRENVEGAENLARACARARIPLLAFSSAQVFGGEIDDLVRAGDAVRPYVESSAPIPLGVYARSKREAERRIENVHEQALVIRSGAFFGPWNRDHFLHRALRAAAAGERFEAPRAFRFTPTYLPHLVHASLDLLIDGERGIWHLANGSDLTWLDFARQAARVARLDPERLVPSIDADPALRKRRPFYSVLESERAKLMPSLEVALNEFVGAAEIQA